MSCRHDPKAQQPRGAGRRIREIEAHYRNRIDLGLSRGIGQAQRAASAQIARPEEAFSRFAAA